MLVKISIGNLEAVAANSIVVPANTHLVRPNTGLGAEIFTAAGNDLEAACKQIGYCGIGKAVYTEAFQITNAVSLIHTVTPICGKCGGREEELLGSCYEASLLLAIELRQDSAAFPLLGLETGFDPRFSAQVALSVFEKLQPEIGTQIGDIYLVVYDQEMYEVLVQVFGKCEFANFEN